MAKTKSLWLRLYTEVLGDPKVQRLPPAIFKTWINLLIVAKLNDDGGRLPKSMDDLAFQLHLSVPKTKEYIGILTKSGLIDDGVMHGWQERQYESDTDPTRFERVRRFRENKKRKAGEEETQNETDVKRVSDAFQNTDETLKETHNETMLKRNETRIETETETETETDNNIRAPQAAATPSSKFIPPTLMEVEAYCAERHNNVDPVRFIDFYTSKGWLVGKAKMRDWRAAVRNWEKPRDGEKQPRIPEVMFDIQEG